MADFCAQCTRDVLGYPEQENDFAALKENAWELCEGCGLHILAPGGRRIHEITGGPEQPLYLDGSCPACARALEYVFAPTLAEEVP